MRVEIVASSFSIDGHLFDRAITTDLARSCFGDPTRIIDAGPAAPSGHRNNQIHLYDGLGIYLIEHHSTHLIKAVTFVWNLELSTFRPLSQFRGEVYLDGHSIGSSISPYRLLSLGLKQTFEADFGQDRGGIYIATTAASYDGSVGQVLELIHLQLSFSPSSYINNA